MNNHENYPTWLVPLDIAQQLKEIDFNEHCLFAFSTEKNDLYIIQRYKKGCVWYDDISLLYEPVVPTDSFLVPTWTDVFAWFRSKGYHSTLHTYSVMLGNAEEFRFYYEINSCQEYIAAPEEYYKTYEQAQTYCLKNLIEIYKTIKK